MIHAQARHDIRDSILEANDFSEQISGESLDLVSSGYIHGSDHVCLLDQSAALVNSVTTRADLFMAIAQLLERSVQICREIESKVRSGHKISKRTERFVKDMLDDATRKDDALRAVKAYGMVECE